MKIQIKTKQGIVSSCDHDDECKDSDKENLVIELGLKHPKKQCVKCLKHLNAITEKFSNNLSAPALLPLKSQLDHHDSISPLVSISVVDADNLNICMCNLMEDQKRHETIEGDKICKICRNIIKQQPSERCTLVSKRVMLGDIVVSRIDTQYLSSNYSSIPAQLRKLQDPYTPESVESHSPQPELDEKEFPIINEMLYNDDILCNMREVNKSNKVTTSFEPESNGELKESSDEEKVANLQNQYYLTHTVSPSQLTTRLENLRRESQLMIYDAGSKSGGGSGADIDDKSSLNKSKCCLRCSCVIS